MAVKEKVSRILNVKYLSSKGKFITDTGVIFTHDEVRDSTPEQVLDLYKERLNGVLYDYSYTKSTGHFRKHKNLEELRAQAQKRLQEDAIPIEPDYSDERDLPAEKEKMPWAIIILKVVMALVGVFAILLSASYTTKFLLKTNSAFVSVILSWAMIIFSVAAFDIIIYFWTRPGHSKKALSAVFAVLWLVVVGFSMYSTMDVNYDGYTALKKASVAESSDTNSARLQIDLITRQISSLEQTLREKSKAASDYATREIVSAYYLEQLQKDVTDAQQKVEEAYQKLIDVSAENSVAAVTEETRAPTLYDSVEGLTKGKITAEGLHFFIHMLPAVFIDIIAPFSIAVALFLGGKDERKEDSDSIA